MNERVRVLITDDQQPTRHGLKAILTFAPQIEVIGEAVNGQEAVRLVTECHPDVVLMDMHMPVMDGLQATRLIKSQCPEIKVIALTIDPTHKIEALKAGVDVFLLKGCTTAALQGAILESSILDEL